MTTITFAEWVNSRWLTEPRCPLCNRKQDSPKIFSDRHQTWQCAHRFHQGASERP